MNNIKAFFLSLLICIIGCSSAVIISTTIPVYAQSNYLNSDELSIALLHPYIEKAITDFYGYNRRYEISDSQLEITERKGNVFTVKVKVDTFEGAHNDYYTEILTFTVTPLNVILEDYYHSDFYK